MKAQPRSGQMGQNGNPLNTPWPLEFNEAGNGGRPLLLVHGFTGGRADFADWMDPLAKLGYHVVAPDLRGHGTTGGPDDLTGYSLELFSADLVGLADRLGWETFDVLGHSMGGLIVQHLVVEQPDLVSRLVLMDTTHGAVPEWTPHCWSWRSSWPMPRAWKDWPT